jgi:autotransporter-associated beta strand protein
VTEAARTLTVNNQISGNFALTKAGAGTLTLFGANTFGGATVISQGALRLAAVRPERDPSGDEMGIRPDCGGEGHGLGARQDHRVSGQ